MKKAGATGAGLFNATYATQLIRLPTHQKDRRFLKAMPRFLPPDLPNSY